jgi:hypothetical protein
MPERANVASVDALQAFRSQLIVYISKARPALEEVSTEVMRTRLWLENEQRTHWEGELKRRKRKWDEAQAALFSAQISNLRDESAAEVQAVHRARRTYEEAEAKLKVLKQWNRNFDGHVMPLVKQMEKLHTLLANDLPKAILYLGEIIATLESYAELGRPGEERALPPGSSAAPAQATESPAHAPLDAPDRVKA